MYLNPVTNNNAKCLYTNQNQNVHFAGKNPQLLEKELKACFSQDIFAPSLAVRLPKTAEEKKVLIEILTNRSELDSLVRLTNDRFKLLADYDLFHSLMEKEPNSQEIPKLRESLQKRGNLSSTLSTMEKKIETLKKKHQRAYGYVMNLCDIADEMLDSHKITAGKMTKFWQDVKKNNINADGKMSTKEILEKVINCKVGETTELQATHPTQALSKKQLLANIERQYEQTLLGLTNIYQSYENHSVDSQKARNAIMQSYSGAIARFPEIKKQLPKIYEKIEKKIMYTVNRLIDVEHVVNGKIVQGVEIHTLDKVWEFMDERVRIAQQAKKEIKELETKLSNNPDDIQLKAALDVQKEVLNEAKSDWLELLGYSVDYEKDNQRLFNEVNRLTEYSYLTERNPIINKHRELHAIVKENQNSLPEETWDKIFA